MKAQEIQEALNAKYPARLVCELPDSEFDFGGLVWSLTGVTGHHSGRATIGGLGLWTVCVSALLKHLH